MVDSLSYKVERLEENIKMLKLASAQDPELIAEINSQLSIADSLIEFYEIPQELIARYNALKLEYADLFGNKRLYYSADRSIRLNKIVQDSANIADIQEFMQQYVSQQANAIDHIATSMAQSELYIDTALEEIGAHRARVNRGMKWWRCLAVIFAVVGGLSVYRLLVR